MTSKGEDRRLTVDRLEIPCRVEKISVRRLDSHHQSTRTLELQFIVATPMFETVVGEKSMTSTK